MKNTNHLVKVLALSGLCLAISYIAQYIFHLAGVQGGKIFLPMFWGIGVAAFILPLKYAVSVALLAPVLSSMTSGMPPVPMLYFMLVELPVYAAALNVLSRKINPYPAVAVSLIISRAVYILTVMAAGTLINLPPAFTGLTILTGSIVVSLPGILLQIIILPIIYKIYRRFA